MRNEISPKGKTKYGLKTIQEYKISFMKNKFFKIKNTLRKGINRSFS